MNVRYTYANQQFLSRQLGWTSDNFRVALINTANYIVNPAVDQHYTDISANGIIAVSTILTNCTALLGIARADDITINTVVGPAIGAVVIFRDSGTPATSELICYLDTGIGLPWIPGGGNLTINWDRGPNGIYRL